jgi:hypothetical protein
MGRVRFYDVSRETYVSLRVEERGLYLEEQAIRKHKERKTMPPRYTPPLPVMESSLDFQERLSDPALLEKVIAVLCDLEETFRLDPKGMFSIKPGLKGNGYQVGVNFRSAWSNYAGKSALEAILSYYDEMMEVQTPPPTPRKRGDGTSKES